MKEIFKDRRKYCNVITFDPLITDHIKLIKPNDRSSIWEFYMFVMLVLYMLAFTFKIINILVYS